MSNSNLAETLDANLIQLESFKVEIQNKNILISKMESDIQRLNALTARSPHSPTDHLETLMSDFTNNAKTSNSNHAPVKSNDGSIVPILTSQRDRYKQRFEESHRNTLDLSAKLVNIADENERLKQDNVSLYEKLKYQENYLGRKSQTDIQIEMGNTRRNDVSERYRSMYEETIDPFRHFKQQENQRAQLLNPAERVAMQFTKLLTGNKYSRLVFVAYSFALHVLVFFALYELMMIETPEKKVPFNMPNKPHS